MAVRTFFFKLKNEFFSPNDRPFTPLRLTFNGTAIKKISLAVSSFPSFDVFPYIGEKGKGVQEGEMGSIKGEGVRMKRKADRKGRLERKGREKKIFKAGIMLFHR